MKKLNLGNINAGLSTIKELANENAGIARDELIDATLIDFANKNTYAANDTDDSIRDLADQIETVGLLNPLGVIQSGNRYKLFSGERRYRAITQYLHWDKIPCRIFEGVSAGRAQLMLHIANGGRDYTAEQKLALYEEYRELLNELKASGEFKGGIQKGVAELMHVSDRQVRTYRTMSEQLTEPEKVDLAAGTLKFGEAQNIAVERAAKATQPTVANATKSGSTSAFSSKAENTKSSLSPEMREDLLRKVIMSGYIWNCEDLLDYYVEMMPTPQEAVKDILKPKYGYHGGTLIMKHFNGSYECTSSKLIQFYFSYLSGQLNMDYVCGIYGRQVEALVQRATDRISSQLFKQAVETNMLTRIVAFEYELSKDEYDKMRSKAVAAVKRSTGRISLFDTMQDSEE